MHEKIVYICAENMRKNAKMRKRKSVKWKCDLICEKWTGIRIAPHRTAVTRNCPHFPTFSHSINTRAALARKQSISYSGTCYLQLPYKMSIQRSWRLSPIFFLRIHFISAIGKQWRHWYRFQKKIVIELLVTFKIANAYLFFIFGISWKDLMYSCSGLPSTTFQETYIISEKS